MSRLTIQDVHKEYKGRMILKEIHLYGEAGEVVSLGLLLLVGLLAGCTSAP